jgi:V8-like Glu-specific endopeptidase
MKKESLLAISVLVLTACTQQKPELSGTISETNSAEIVGGEEVLADDLIAKSTVLVYDRKVGSLCTGTLIDYNLVVTAAHCTSGDAKTLAIGFGLELDGSSLQFAPVIAGMTHSSWPKLTEAKASDPRSKDWGDIAVLRFQGPTPEGFEPARLLGNASSLKNGLTITIAGYGKLDMELDISAEKLMKTDVVLTNKAFSGTEIEFAQHEGRGACHGDSGGPAFAKNKNGKLVLIGVTSRSATPGGGATCLEGSIYTSVAAYIEFIRSAAVTLRGANPPTVIPQPAFE